MSDDNVLTRGCYTTKVLTDFFVKVVKNFESDIALKSYISLYGFQTQEIKLFETFSFIFLTDGSQMTHALN
jgi:hypothetical protein